MKLHSIEIGFMNGDTCIIPEYDVEQLDMKDVYTNVTFDHTINNVVKALTVGEVTLIINPNANIEFKEFGIDSLKTTVFDRIMNGRDINRIIIHYSVNVRGTYFIRQNLAQTTRIENRKLFIHIQGGLK